MKNLFDQLLGTIAEHLDIIIPCAIGLLILWGTGYLLAQYLIRLGDRLHKRLPKELHRELVKLLSNERVVETYAPATRYIEDLPEPAEGQRQTRPMTNAWMSPYARAVKASVKRKGRVGKGQFFNARRQIKEASRHLEIRPLNQEEKANFLVNPEKPHGVFAIKLEYDGKDPDQIRKLAKVIPAQLGLKSMEEQDDDNPYALTFIASHDTVEDRLTDMKKGIEFLDEHPAKRPEALPMAFTANGDVWTLPTHHTFIYGTTGSGKSSPLLSTIYQMQRFVEQGRVNLYGIDPKSADIRVFEKSNIFEDIALDVDDQIDLINELHHSMNERGRNVKYDLTQGETGQSFKPTKATPWNILLVDELFALKNDLNRSKEGKAAWTNLENILAKGRSNGYFVIAASQFADTENLKNLRQNFANVIVLRQPSDHFNDLFLGEGAQARGYDSTKIPSSNAANGYRYSGIGYVMEDGGSPLKVRFAYLSSDAIAKFVLEHPSEAEELKLGAEPSSESKADDGEGGGDFQLPSLDPEEDVSLF